MKWLSVMYVPILIISFHHLIETSNAEEKLTPHVVQYRSTRALVQSISESVIINCGFSSQSEKVESLTSMSEEQLNLALKSNIDACPNKSMFINYVKQVENNNKAQFISFWGILNPRLKQILISQFKQSGADNFSLFVMNYFKKNENGTRRIELEFGEFDEEILKLSDELLGNNQWLSIHTNLCVEYLGLEDPSRCYSLDNRIILVSQLPAVNEVGQLNGSENASGDEEGTQSEGSTRGNITIENPSELGGAAAPTEEEINIDPGVAINGLDLEGKGWLGPILRALKINLRVALDLSTEDEIIVDNVPDTITVNTRELENLTNLEINSGQVKSICSANGEELIRLEGLENLNAIGFTLVSPGIIKLLNCLANSTEGASEVVKGLLECAQNPLKCGMDTIEALAEFFKMLDELGKMLDSLLEGLEELKDLSQAAKEKLICNMIGQAIIESAGGAAIAKALPKISMAVMRKIKTLKRIIKSKLRLTPDLLDIVTTLSEQDLKRIEVIQKMAQGNRRPNSLNRTNRKLEAELRRCTVR